jgi:hypothetical protein
MGSTPVGDAIFHKTPVVSIGVFFVS